MNRSEYDNTVRDLLQATGAPSSTLPPDEEALGFTNNALALSVSQLHVERYLEAAEKLADAANLSTLLPCTPSATLSEQACGSRIISELGRRAFRRPLTNSEVADLQTRVFEPGRAQFGFDTAARMVIQALLQAAPFLYRVEAPPPPDASAAPDPYEMASRLSYLVWSSMPDDTLLAEAAAGRLATATEIEAQARRMLASAKARTMVAAFHREWLGLNALDSVTKSASVYPSFASLRSSMRQETEQFTEHVFWTEGNLSRLFDGGYTFVNASLASFYGIAGVPASGFARVALPPERSGILTQASLLSIFGKSDSSHPVLRGKFVREHLLCQMLPPPPPGVPQVTPVDPNLSTRDRFAQHSEDPACSGCHQLTDGIGFGLENFDGMGAYRATEAGKPVDASGNVANAGSITGPFTGAVALSRKLASSELVTKCLALQWFRYAYGRNSTAEDRCTLERLEQRLAAKAMDPRELVVALTQTDAFLYRGAVPAVASGSSEPQPSAATVAKLTAPSVSASANDGNLPANVNDGSLGTRWAAQGDGQWIQLDLGSSRTVAHVEVAFPYGAERVDRFELQLSEDGVSFTTAYQGAGSGTSTALQRFELTDTKARYVRFLGHGNSQENGWNSVSELQAFGFQE